jgi:uncharacterized protein
MVKMLVIADVHGEFEKLSKLMQKLKPQDFDMVVCPGDFTDMLNIPEGYSQDDIAELVVQELLSLGKPALFVLGNHDPHEIIEIFEEYGSNLHCCPKVVGGIQFIGFGGAATPFNTKFEPGEEETRHSLEKMLPHIKGKFVLITHAPPKGTKMDTIQNGQHVGSEAIRKFIEVNKPILTISAHIHENAGTDKIGDTTIFYPGALFDGRYGIVTIEGNKVTCELKKF